MNTKDVIDQARDAMSVRQVFGEPVEKNGVTVIPAAKVIGGGGGGEGTSGEEQGSGKGFGLVARPVGAYVLRGEELSWQPAVDVNRLILGGQIVAVIALLVLRAIVKSRARGG